MFCFQTALVKAVGKSSDLASFPMGKYGAGVRAELPALRLIWSRP